MVAIDYKGPRDVDKDINTLATITPSVEILGPITQSRAQQLILMLLCL
jgi:hypothetical protein